MYKQKEQVETQIEYQNKEIIRKWKDLNINQNEHKLSRFTLIYSNRNKHATQFLTKDPKRLRSVSYFSLNSHSNQTRVSKLYLENRAAAIKAPLSLLKQQ